MEKIRETRKQEVEIAITDTKCLKDFCYEREQRNGEEAGGGKLIILHYM